MPQRHQHTAAQRQMCTLAAFDKSLACIHVCFQKCLSMHTFKAELESSWKFQHFFCKTVLSRLQVHSWKPTQHTHISMLTDGKCSHRQAQLAMCGGLIRVPLIDWRAFCDLPCLGTRLLCCASLASRYVLPVNKISCMNLGVCVGPWMRCDSLSGHFLNSSVKSLSHQLLTKVNVDAYMHSSRAHYLPDVTEHNRVHL